MADSQKLYDIQLKKISNNEICEQCEECEGSSFSYQMGGPEMRGSSNIAPTKKTTIVKQKANRDSIGYQPQISSERFTKK